MELGIHPDSEVSISFAHLQLSVKNEGRTVGDKSGCTVRHFSPSSDYRGNSAAVLVADFDPRKVPKRKCLAPLQPTCRNKKDIAHIQLIHAVVNALIQASGWTSESQLEGWHGRFDANQGSPTESFSTPLDQNLLGGLWLFPLRLTPGKQPLHTTPKHRYAHSSKQTSRGVALS